MCDGTGVSDVHTVALGAFHLFLLTDGGGCWSELMLEVTSMAVCMVLAMRHWSGGAATSKLDYRVPWERTVSGSRARMPTDMVVPKVL